MYKATDKHTLLRNWELDERVRDQLLGSGLEFFHDLVRDNAGYLHDSRFVDALKRFYDEKTYCFNLGEDKCMFFGADSVLFLTGLKFSGEVVRKKNDDPLGEVDGRNTLVDGLGWIDTKFVKGKSIKLEGLKKFMRVGDQNLEHCVNAYILFLVGTVIVTTSARKVPLTYLDCIKNGRFKEHAWGLALLSNMHHYLRELQDQKHNSACTYLFMIFFFEHLPGLRDAFFTEDGDLIFAETDSLPAEFPLSLSWAPYVQRILKNRRSPLDIDYISVMANSEITWNVYEKRLGENFLPVNIRGDFEMRLYRGPLIHPLHNSNKGYQHRPDYCPKHFGVDYVVYKHCPQIVLPYKGIALMEEQWRNWKNCLIQLPALGTPHVDDPTSSSQPLSVEHIKDLMPTNYTREDMLGLNVTKSALNEAFQPLPQDGGGGVSGDLVDNSAENNGGGGGDGHGGGDLVDNSAENKRRRKTINLQPPGLQSQVS